LAFVIALTASVPQPPRLANIKGKPTKRIVRTLTTESPGGNPLTYEKELLNSRKNSRFYKTNHPGFAASVRQPSPLAKTNGKPTKRIVRNLRAKCAGGNKTNHPVFPHALPPYDKNRRVSRKNVVRGFSLVRGWHYRTLKGRTRVPLGSVKPTNSYVVARFTAASAMTPPHYVFARHSSAEGCRSNLGGGGGGIATHLSRARNDKHKWPVSASPSPCVIISRTRILPAWY